MTITKNAAAILTDFCRKKDAATESLITERMKELAEIIHGRQQDILHQLQEYRAQLSSVPSETEFCDLMRLLAGHNGCNQIWNEMQLGCVDSKDWNAWLQDSSVPPMPARRHLMLMFLDAHLEHEIYSGVGRLSQTLVRASGEDLLSGDWRLPSRSQPSFVEWMPNERWRVADVILPVNVDWYDRCGSNTHLIEPRSYTNELAQLVNDVVVADLLMPKGTSVGQNLLTRLQKHPGVGSKKAHQMIAWLSDVGCTFLKGGPAREEMNPPPMAGEKADW